ncbi:MAG: ABC transporter ATP-binding protein [Gammaproteobacteria bacterium]|nr:MAG: ABC transporter ATP-binding protein [Gammaproteobacteria bacterium]
MSRTPTDSPENASPAPTGPLQSGTGATRQDVVVSVRQLEIDFETTDALVHAVRGLDFDVHRGECLGIVGESGSGKSQTFLAAMGLLAPNGIPRGEILFRGRNLLTLPERELCHVRGNHLGMIFQDPLTSLTPHMRIGDQMRETLNVHQSLSRSTQRRTCLEWLERVRIPDIERRYRQYPHELSGGMRQRIMIAMAMLCRPELLIADEPTTALDVTIQAEILDLMQELQHEEGTAIALITHDMGVIARLCDQVHVMKDGRFIESGPVDDIFNSPQEPYTQRLLDAVPRLQIDAHDDHASAASPATDADAASAATADPKPDTVRLDVNDVSVHFTLHSGLFGKPVTLPAVDKVSLELAAGETLGIVGESGSGKSTLARAILQLIPPTEGEVVWLGTELQTLDRNAMNRQRKDLQIVFQDPLASLDPSMTIGKSVEETLRHTHPLLKKAERRQRVLDTLARVGLDKAFLNRYPHELSGGQNQRVGIARAIISEPRLLICDEAVSALDVSIQADILALIAELKQEMDLSVLFISHDLSVVSEIADRVLVLYLGAVVEYATARSLFNRPQHPYTRSLISAVPLPDPVAERQRERVKLPGRSLPASDPAARWRFLPKRAATAGPDDRPRLEECFPGHWVAEFEPT